MPDYHKHLEAINESLARAQAYQLAIRQAMARIKKAGMYPAVPTERWQSKDDEAQGLHMVFPRNADGTYQGPNGERQVYVGTAPEQQAEARRLVENRRRWEQLQWALDDLERWLDLRQSELQSLAKQCGQWPETELLKPD